MNYTCASLSDFKLWIRLWSLCLRAPSNGALPSAYTLCSLAMARHGVEAGSPLHLIPLSPLCMTQPCSQRPSAASWILFWGFAFYPQLTPTSCVTMSDSFVFLGSLFVKEVCFDHPLQVSPLPTHSATSPCGPLFIPLFNSCLLPLLACKACESGETVSALLLPYCGFWRHILALSRESTSTCVRG